MSTDERPEADETELVGPGGFPLRIQPAAALQPGTADVKRLLVLWFVRKSFYWIFFTGISIALVAEAASTGQIDDLEVDITSPSSYGQTILSPAVGLLVALLLRFIVNWIALGLAFPLALAHEPNLSPRTNFGSGIGRFFDRLHLARAFRSLRWTHHVREVAIGRIDDEHPRVRKIDPILDVVNIASGVLVVPAMFVAGMLSN